MGVGDDWLSIKIKEVGFSKGDIIETKHEDRRVRSKLTGIVKDLFIPYNAAYLLVSWLEPVFNPGPFMVWPERVRLVNDPEIEALLILKYQGIDLGNR
jgi:hypothetical protein